MQENIWGYQNGREEREPCAHAGRLGRADHHGRRSRPACRCVPADRRGEASGHSQLWALRQGAVVPGRLQGQLGAPDQGGARGAGGLEQQVSELGAGRSGEMGAGRLCLRARQLAWRRALAGPPRRVVAARGAGSLSMRRMGRYAALEQRQGRHQRHLLLRHEPVAGRRAQSAAPRRPVHLGRFVRLLSRALPSRRHPVGLPVELVSAPGRERAARRGRTRRKKRSHRRSRGRTAHVERRGAGEGARRHSRRSDATAPA